MIAHRIAQLDHMARGRFHWGVGSGGFPGDFEVFGFDPLTGEHRAMTRDSIDLVLKIWDDPEPGLYEHKYWKFRIPEPVEEVGLRFHIKPYQKPHPPIGVAGVSPKSDTLVLAGERGWIPMSINLVPNHVLKTHWTRWRKRAKRRKNAGPLRLADCTRGLHRRHYRCTAREEALEGVLRRDFEQYFLRLMPRIKMLHLLKTDPDMADSDVPLSTWSTTYGSWAAPTTWPKSCVRSTLTLAALGFCWPWATSGSQGQVGQLHDAARQ